MLHFGKKFDNIIYNLVPEEKCTEKRKYCKESGGRCQFNLQKGIECSCPKNTVYEEDLGCQGK